MSCAIAAKVSLSVSLETTVRAAGRSALLCVGCDASELFPVGPCNATQGENASTNLFFMVRISKKSRRRSSWSMFGAGMTSVSESATSRSSFNTMIDALRNTRSRLSSNDARSFGVCLLAVSKISTNDSCEFTNLAAVFSPTPGVPSRLSLGSPRSAAYST